MTDEPVKVVVLTVETERGTDEYYLVLKGEDEALIVRSLSDTEVETIDVVTNAELTLAMKNNDVERIRRILEIEYGEPVKFSISVYEGPKARLLLESLAMNADLKEVLKVFLV